jgi:hypothetical protein
MDDIIKGILGLALIAACFALVFVGPIFTIWSLNLIFGTEIPVDFKHWIAVLWLATILRGVNITLKRNS